MKIKTIPIFILFTALVGACAGFDPQAFVPGLYTPTPPKQETSTSGATATLIPTSTETRSTVSLQVCTSVTGGKLHVRVMPGDNSEVRGYLLDGETVVLEEESQNIGRSKWQKLSNPIEGWVNAKYLCEIK